MRPPPELPTQGIGPHVELNSDGIISFPPADSLDREGNHLPRLRALHPDLRELARELLAGLSRGNAPHAVLCERVAIYVTLIDQDLQSIDFRRLYSAGVRLSNATHATDRAISIGELPQFEPSEGEKRASLLDLHGSFILATAAGAEAVEDEERYRRRPSEERRYRADAIAMATALQGRPELVDPEVAEQLLGAARDIGQGYNPERSTVAGRAMVRNVTISIVGGAIGSAVLMYAGPLVAGAGAATAFVGTLAISETIKMTRWFSLLTESMASRMDNLIDAPSRAAAEKFRSGLRRHSQFVTANEPTLRRLAGRREELRFLRRALDWLSGRNAR